MTGVVTSSSRVRINPPGRDLGGQNAIVSGRLQPQRVDQHIVSDFEGPLSIKFMVEGTGHWETREGRYRVDGRRYVILNPGQSYSLTMERGSVRESFCPMFADGFLDDVARAVSEDAGRLLDAPSGSGGHAPGFAEHLRDCDERLHSQLLKLHAGFRSGATDSCLADQFHDLAEALLAVEASWWAGAARLPAARPATRVELWRRVHTGRDYLHAHAFGPLALSDVARAASLSPHHFHRLFRSAFGETPHRYQTRLRLSRAAALLERGDRSVTEVCLAAGFESLGSFSSLFRRRFGVSPARYRTSASPIRKIGEVSAPTAG